MKLNENSKRFFMNGILLTAVSLGMRTVALFFNAFVTREVGAVGIGLYTLVMTVYNFAVTFATSGISLTVTRLVAEARGEGKEGEVGKILTGSVIYALIFSLIGAAVLFLGAEFFALRVLDDVRTAICLKILAPSLIPLALISVFSGYFVGIKRVAGNAVTQISGQLFKVGITVFLIVATDSLSPERSAVCLSLGTTLTELLCFFVIFLQYLVDKRGKKREIGNAFPAVFRTAAPLAVSAYIRQALITLEHIIIPKRLRKYGESANEALASYGTLHGMALPMVLYPMATLSSFSGLLVPEFAERSAKGDGDGMKRLASRAFGTTLSYAIVVCVFLLLFSEELGYVIYNSRSAGVYIAVLAPVVPIMYLDHVTDSVLKGIGEQVYSMWVNITDSILSVILVWLLIPKMGIMGYAICIVVMEGYNFLLSLIRLRVKIRFRISFVRSILLPGISALISAGISLGAFRRAGAQSTPLLLIIEVVFALCIYIGVSRLFTLFITKKDSVTRP